MDPLETTIRHHLVRYLAGTETLADLTESVVDALWSLEPDRDDQASQLVYAVQLALAELADGLLTPVEFRAELRELIAHITVNLQAEPQPIPKLGSTARTTVQVIGERARLGERALQWVPALRPQAARPQLEMALA